MVNNGPGNQLRKESYEQAVVQKIILLCFPTACVKQIGDLLKRKKRDCQRKNDFLKDNITTSQSIDIVNKEVGVLEVSQQTEVS